MRTVFSARLVTALVVASLLPRDGAPQDIPVVSNLVVAREQGQPSAARKPIASAGDMRVVVQLVDPALAVAHGRNAKRAGGRLSASQQRDYVAGLRRQHDALAGEIRRLRGRELGRLNKLLNAVVVAIDASQLPALAALPGVRTVRLLRDYQLDLSTTVPYIGATAVHQAGVDGSGVRVAVLDTGIDYTHKAFGGPGTLAAYQQAYGTAMTDARNTTTNGLFPTAKVVNGYDFVGEQWPNGPLAPDPDPIDCGPSAIGPGCGGGHGTHVADIIAGNDGGSHRGVAPGASLLAVKVCGAVVAACDGLAVLQGLEFALDPDGNGDISDAVDVINMSFGLPYGQVHEIAAEAASIAAQLGIVVVAAAGNSGDRPYMVSSPSVAPEVISVAQTQAPNTFLDLMEVTAPADIADDYAAVFQRWSAAPTSAIQAPVQYGNGADGNLDGCAAFPAGSLTGKIILIDRGVCSLSDKIRRIAAGGGLVGVIGLTLPGDPSEGPSGSGPAVSIPAYMISQSASEAIRSRLAAGVIARFDPGRGIPVGMSMTSTSVRGPSSNSNSIKPEIGAPGASISAEAGTGEGQTVFGGTSGAAPMIAGSAALLIQANPRFEPLEIKARLMNTAATNIETGPLTQPGGLAPITRIGSGEVRVNRALASTTAAWDAGDLTPSLSFGYQTIGAPTTLDKTIEVRNYSNQRRTYSINTTFRYASDAASGAVGLEAPSSLTVSARSSATFKMKVRVDPMKLPVWALNGGSLGADGFRLQGVEFDGFVAISDDRDTIRLPWHLLPHRAADVTPDADAIELKNGIGAVVLKNQKGAIDGRVDVFSLLGQNRRIPRRLLPGPGDGFDVIDLASVGARLVDTELGPSIQFAIHTFDRRAHPNFPAEFDIYIDADRDGAPDSVVFNMEDGGFAATGQNVVGVYNFAANSFGVYFYADADLDSANIILTAPLFAAGLNAGSAFDFSVYAFEKLTIQLTDAIEGMTFTPALPRFAASGAPPAGVPAGGRSILNVEMVPGGETASPSQTGILLMYRDGKTNREADAIKIEPSGRGSH